MNFIKGNLCIISEEKEVVERLLEIIKVQEHLGSNLSITFKKEEMKLFRNISIASYKQWDDNSNVIEVQFEAKAKIDSFLFQANKFLNDVRFQCWKNLRKGIEVPYKSSEVLRNFSGLESKSFELKYDILNRNDDFSTFYKASASIIHNKNMKIENAVLIFTDKSPIKRTMTNLLKYGYAKNLNEAISIITKREEDKNKKDAEEIFSLLKKEEKELMSFFQCENLEELINEMVYKSSSSKRLKNVFKIIEGEK